MLNLRKMLPPINSLVAFEASARHLSFTRAGQELLISREAVSRQIRILEGYLGTKLFVRLYRAIELTPAGEEMYEVVAASLDQIAIAAASVLHKSQPSKITITATVAITTFWLTPRLSLFSKAYPDVEISINVSDSPVDMMETGSDIGIFYGAGKWPRYKATHLFDINSFPVCTPQYMEDTSPINAISDLENHTLLYLNGTMHSSENWDWWAENQGEKLPKNIHKLGFDSYANVIQAAMNHQGVALAFTNLVGDQITKGRLVEPIDGSIKTDYSVYMVASRGKPLTKNAQYFFNWVVDLVAEEQKSMA